MSCVSSLLPCLTSLVSRPRLVRSVLCLTLSPSLLAGELTARFDPGQPFSVSQSVPAGATRWTPALVSNDLADVTCVTMSIAAVTRDETERWQALRIPLVAELPAVGVRTNAVKAFLLGCGGIVAPATSERKYAEDDIAALAAVSALSFRARAATAPDKIWLEGRMGHFQLDHVDVATDDMDIVRLEAIARVRRLAALLKERPPVLSLETAPHPEPKPRLPRQANRHAPNRSEIDAALQNGGYADDWQRAFAYYDDLCLKAREEAQLIGWPDPGVPTCCWREGASETMFKERVLDPMRRPYLEDIENLRHNPKEPYKPVKALGLNADEKRALYAKLGAISMLPAQVKLARIDYLKKRLNGVEIVKPAAEKKKLVLDLDAEEPSGADALEL